MRPFFKKLWDYRVPIAVIATGVLLLGALIWWLVKQNSTDTTGSADGTSGERDRKGAITSGLKDGKDYGTDYSLDEKATFAALVVLRDQQSADPAEDRRSSLKRGDVLAVRKLPHLWSDTERASYLIVTIEMTGREANALIEAKKDGDSIVAPRAKKIDLDRVGFTGDQVVDGQPLEGKTLEKQVIVER